MNGQCRSAPICCRCRDLTSLSPMNARKTPFLPILALIPALLLALTLNAGCFSRGEEQPPQEAPQSEVAPQPEIPVPSALSEGAAAAFAELDPTVLKPGDAWKTFRIDPAQSTARYVVDEELFADATRKYGLEIGKTKVVGVTGDLAGLLQLDLTQREIGANRFAVFLPTLQTDQALRDAWLRENALESDRFPLAILVADRLLDLPESYREGEEIEFRMEGPLDLRGTLQTTVWDVAATLSGGTIRGSMHTRLRMTNLGFDPPDFANTLTVQDEFTIQIDFVAHEE